MGKTLANNPKKSSPARARILAKAEELFYTQGYQATGINQIIAESDVAKATFYAHFPSKDDLCLAYLNTVSRREQAHFLEAVAQARTPLGKFMCTAEILVPWLEETGFRGCTFLNMVPEVVDHEDPIRREAAAFYKQYENIIKQAAGDLIASDAKKYGHLDAVTLARDYMTVIAGGISLSALHHTVAPMKRAVKLIEALVG